MSISIRQAQSSDVEALAALDTRAPHDPERTKLIREWVKNGECYIAEVKGSAVGYAALNDRFFRQGQADMLMVHSDFRRRGLGSQLLEYLVSLCPTEKFWITTNLSNQPMQRLLAKHGFTLSGFVDHLDEGDPELVFFKRVR